MNKKQERKHQFAITRFVVVCVSCVMLLTVIISYIVVAILLSRDMIPTTIEGWPTPKYTLMLMLAINLIVGLCTTVFASHLILKYINRFINQMNRLAAGDFKARLSFGELINMHPTVEEIIDSFNRMAEELENTKMLRSDFINNFSHEFKTPIVSIAGFAKLLKRGNLTEQQKMEYLDIIEEESLRLATMATNVLNMTKIETQMILTDICTFNLSEQIRFSVLILENRWAKKNIEFGLEFDEYDIEANEELLKQIWINLIDNAIKFSPEYGLIVIKITDAGESYKITIANSGIEIPLESQKKIFDKFYQADESHASEGSGIGLAIVKRVTDLHKGEVSVECKSGITTFMVELPKLV